MTPENETEDVPCTCDGFNPNCSRCSGTGYITRPKRPPRPDETEAVRLEREAEGRRKYEESQRDLHQQWLEAEKKQEEEKLWREATERERSEEVWNREWKGLLLSLLQYPLFILGALAVSWIVHSCK
jgi:hypothetical protein